MTSGGRAVILKTDDPGLKIPGDVVYISTYSWQVINGTVIMKYSRSGHLFQDRFSNEEVECLDISDRRRIPDKDALEIIRNELHLQS